MTIPMLSSRKEKTTGHGRRQDDIVDVYPQRIEKTRKSEYPHLQNTAYLDHGGLTPYAKSSVARTSSDLNSNLYGNPHSQSPSSALSTQRIENARLRMLEFFRADPQYFDLIFVANTTAAIKLVADGIRGGPRDGKDAGFWYGYHSSSHTSLVGLRELATRAKCFNSDKEVEDWLSGKLDELGETGLGPSNTQNGLFAYPAQSNMNGRRLPLNWPGSLRTSARSQSGRVFSLLDAAAYAMTAQLDLSDHGQAPDFVALSFHKIFGFPDLGALIVRKEAGHVLLQRRYFGGGTVDMVINADEAEHAWHANKMTSLHEALEDGTPAFHNILALEPALDVHRSLYRDMNSISTYTCRLAETLFESMSRLTHGNGVPLCRIYKDPAAQYGDAKSQGPTIALNLQTSTGRWVKKSHVEQLAVINGIQLRTGGVCNPGGIAWALNISANEMRLNYAEGLRCGNGLDELNGKPTGIVRVSLGAMSNEGDIMALLSFLRLFVEGNNGNFGAPVGLHEPKVRGSTTDYEAKRDVQIRVAATTGDRDHDLPEYQCPVAACEVITQDEAKLLTHFQTHKLSGLYRGRAQDRSKETAGFILSGILRAMMKPLRHLCH